MGPHRERKTFLDPSQPYSKNNPGVADSCPPISFQPSRFRSPLYAERAWAHVLSCKSRNSRGTANLETLFPARLTTFHLARLAAGLLCGDHLEPNRLVPPSCGPS